MPVEGTGGNLRLTDVADIKVDHQPLIGDAVVNDSDGLLLVVEKFPARARSRSRRGGARARQAPAALSGLSTDTSVFRPATLIEDAIDNLTLTLMSRDLLLALAVAPSTEWRTVLAARRTIPVSLVAAALLLDALGGRSTRSRSRGSRSRSWW